jgi:hypothetical protein
MIVHQHIHYVIAPTGAVVKHRFNFDPPVEVESPVTVDGPWFDLGGSSRPHTLQHAGGGPTVLNKMQAPRLLRGDDLHFDDAVSSVSVAVPPGYILAGIDPGSVQRAEVDLTLVAELAQGRVVARQLVFLFLNPSPQNPVPFNVDARLEKDSHDYVRRLHESRDRSYHKLLLRKCLAPGFQVWPDVMTLSMAAAYCQVAKSTMATWVKDGWIKASSGTKPRILKKNIDAYLESR